MKRQLLTLAIAAASFAAAPLAFAQDPQATPDPQQSAQAGQVTWARAIREGRIQLDGVPSLARAFPTWNARSMFANIRPVSHT